MGEMQSFSKLAHTRHYLILLTITDNMVDQPGDVQEQCNYSRLPYNPYPQKPTYLSVYHTY